jgi:hypothetical protein
MMLDSLKGGVHTQRVILDSISFSMIDPRLRLRQFSETLHLDQNSDVRLVM